tara:strand:- start:314 stop:541 length:228 start_codon:yes stop_codon:yes gene_type:complete
MKMYTRQNKLKTIINLLVVVFVSFVGFLKVKTLLGYLIGVPTISWIAYLLSNAMCSDLIFGETTGCSEKSIFKDE